MRLSSYGCLLPFAFAWCLFTLALDYSIVSSIRKSWQSQKWPTASAYVVESSIQVKDDGDESVYRPLIRYRYRVDGALLNGQRYRWNYLNFSRQEVRKAVSDYPVGRRFEVYYNPSNEAQSVIDPGLTSRQLNMAIFVLPFNCAGMLMLGLPWWTRQTACGFPLRRQGSQWQIRSHYVSPVLASVAWILLLSFGLALINFGFRSLLSPALLVGEVLLLIVTGLLAGWSTWRKNGDPTSGIVLDTESERLWTPEMGPLPVTEIQAFVVSEELTEDSDGDPATHFHLDLLTHSNSRLRLLTQIAPERAAKLRYWLSLQLNLEDPESCRGI